MKLLAVEVVCQLALDTVSELPKDSLLFSQLIEQVQESSTILTSVGYFVRARRVRDKLAMYGNTLA